MKILAILAAIGAAIGLVAVFPWLLLIAVIFVAVVCIGSHYA